MRRPVGQKESSRIRKNAFAYDDEHGLGLCSPAGAVDCFLDVRTAQLVQVNNLRSVGEAMVVDQGAKLGNWFMT